MAARVLIISKDRPEVAKLKENLEKAGYAAVFHKEMSDTI